ncbi:MAG: DMT family transporter [Candidatus Dormibacteraceae bacterium]
MQSTELWIVVPTAIGGAAGFGLAGALQHTTMAREQTRPSLRAGLVKDLIDQPLWIASLVATGIGSGLQLVALSTGPLAMVEPLLVTGLLFAVLFRSLFRRHWPHTSTMIGAGLCVAGLATFLAIARPPGGAAMLELTETVPLAIALAVVLVICIALAIWRGGRTRSLAFAVAGGSLFGVSAAIAKVATGVVLGHGIVALFVDWPLYTMAVLGPAGFLMTQHAYRAHPELAPAQAVITLTDPLVGITIGILWLHEAIQASPPAIAGEVLGLIGLAGGVWLLAHHAAGDTKAAQGNRPPPAPEARPSGERS